jgi:hypothetical protein
MTELVDNACKHGGLTGAVDGREFLLQEPLQVSKNGVCRPPGRVRGARMLRTFVLVFTSALMWACAGDEPPLRPDRGGTPLWIDLDFDQATDEGGPTGPIPPAEQRTGGPIRFADVSDAVGFSDVVSGGNTHGVGVAFADLDGDQWPDVLVINGRSNVNGEQVPSRLMRNRGDGTFEDASQASGIAQLLDGVDGYSVAAADIDEDGDVDLYIGAQPRDLLLLGRGDGSFEDGTDAAGAGGPPSDPTLVGDGKSKIVAIGDHDNDGHLDLVSASSTLDSPGAYLLRNRMGETGEATFEDVTESSRIRIAPSGNPCAVMWTDYDNDGDPDLFIWNDRGGHVLLDNDGGVFDDVTEASGLSSVGIRNPMGIDAGDIDLDGDLDYYVSNIGNNPLLRNNGDGTFSDITRRAGTEGEYGWGLAFADFDLDGWLDIFVSQEDDRPHLTFANRGVVPSSFERIEVPHIPVRDDRVAHNKATAFADYDGDGRVDVVTTTTDASRITLYRNETDPGTAGFIHVVVGAPPSGVGSSSGVGARVVVAAGDVLRFRDVTAGSSRASQNEVSVRLGLGQVRGADWVGIVWPNGEQRVFINVAAGSTLEAP